MFSESCVNSDQRGFNILDAEVEERERQIVSGMQIHQSLRDTEKRHRKSLLFHSTAQLQRKQLACTPGQIALQFGFNFICRW